MYKFCHFLYMIIVSCKNALHEKKGRNIDVDGKVLLDDVFFLL